MAAINGRSFDTTKRNETKFYNMYNVSSLFTKNIAHAFSFLTLENMSSIGLPGLHWLDGSNFTS